MTSHSSVSVERRSPESVFALLGDETRAEIIRALGETPNRTVSFSELRERVGVRDSGQFNYHLRKLCDVFVRQTDEGYELTHAGDEIVGAMYAGTYTADAEIEPFPVGSPCPLCGSDLLARYEDEQAVVECGECEEYHNRFSFPPGSLDQFPQDDLPAVFDRWMQTLFERLSAGFCTTCAGRVEGELRLTQDDAGWSGEKARARYQCTRCGHQAWASGWTPVLYHPATRGFLYDHGIDQRETPSWELAAECGVPDVAVRSTDPPRIRGTLTIDDETFAATIDSDLSVIEVERAEGE